MRPQMHDMVIELLVMDRFTDSQQVNGQGYKTCRSSIEDRARRITSLLRGSVDILYSFGRYSYILYLFCTLVSGQKKKLRSPKRINEQ